MLPKEEAYRRFVLRVSKGGTPLAHDFAKQSVVCYTLCRRCRNNVIATPHRKTRVIEAAEKRAERIKIPSFTAQTSGQPNPQSCKAVRSVPVYGILPIYCMARAEPPRYRKRCRTGSAVQ